MTFILTQNPVFKKTDPGYYQWVVPEGTTEVTVKLWGAGGGSSTLNGEAGGYVEGTLAVTPGETLNIRVGGAGRKPNGGYNGGGDGASSSIAKAGGGGGATDIRQGGDTHADVVVLAGGGGGGTQQIFNPLGQGNIGPGAKGGPDTGEDAPDQATSNTIARGGHGGSQLAGGAGGAVDGPSTTASTDGSALQGGDGGRADDGSGDIVEMAGGGGSGYYGGGGGGAEVHDTNNEGSAAGGGGGSNYDDGLSSVTANLRGDGAGRDNDGRIDIMW